ncbi:MAG: hypothetical protein WBP79_00050 [Candidatus Acidiferrales bacterium]
MKRTKAKKTSKKRARLKARPLSRMKSLKSTSNPLESIAAYPILTEEVGLPHK